MGVWSGISADERLGSWGDIRGGEENVQGWFLWDADFLRSSALPRSHEKRGDEDAGLEVFRGFVHGEKRR